MLEILKKLNLWNKNGPSKSPGNEIKKYTGLKPSLDDNITLFQGLFDHCSDFICKEFTVCQNRAAVLMIDNMIDKVVLTSSVMNPLTDAVPPAGACTPEDRFVWLRDCVLSSIDEKEIFTVEDCVSMLTAGFVIFLYDGVDKGLFIGIQGYAYRSIGEPSGEKVLRGARDGFTEPLRINISLVRRRLRNTNLKFEIFSVGSESKTDICVAYIKGIAAESVVNEVIRRINHIDCQVLLDSGNIQFMLSDHPNSIFHTTCYTERPDTFCAKLNEGRVGILVDGTPIALFMPCLLMENFQNIDDYSVSSYYATFTRILKYIAFVTSFLLPGLYVAVGSFNQSLLPTQLLHTLAQAEEATPFNLIFEALLMQIIYEMLREAGLRLPKQIGFAITIVGALIVGEAAVSAGLIGAPMVIIVALTATTSLVVPTLYEPGVIMRFAFIFLAGFLGMYGIALGIAFIGFHLCSLKSYDIPFTAPITPMDLFSMRDVVLTAPSKILARKRAKVQDMPGSDVDKNQN